LESSWADAIANCEVPAETARAIMLHFITRIVICSFGFRKSTAVPPVFYLGGSFFLCRRKLISRRQLLAILAIFPFSFFTTLSQIASSMSQIHSPNLTD
jgi:hypothetical protein